MAFLGFLSRNKLPDLNTWVVTTSASDVWEGINTDSYKPGTLNASSLSDLIDNITTTVRESYIGSGNESTAELQYAIYPWGESKTIDFIFQISKSDKGYVAHDIQGSNIKVVGKSLEELSSQISSQVSDSSQAMMQWVLPVQDLI
jgi:hypothetical protein